VGGWLIVALGAALVVWAIRARARSSLFGWSWEKASMHAPYARIRRPLALGWLSVGLGSTMVVGTAQAWVCYLAEGVAALILMELDDWDLRSRLPAFTRYCRRTPRFFPRRRRGVGGRWSAPVRDEHHDDEQAADP
jgi:protein-S-isoprenylcysteine O-methyltransferase Ste14